MFHLYRAVIDPASAQVVEQDTSKDSWMLFEAQHQLEAGLQSEFERLVEAKEKK